MTKDSPICQRCNMALLPSKAIEQTWVGHDDFGGDAGQPGTTISAGGPGKLVDCLKCPKCGYSITRGTHCIETLEAGVWETQDIADSLEEATMLASSLCKHLPDHRIRISTPDNKLI